MDKLSNSEIDQMSEQHLRETVRDLRNLALVQDVTLHLVIAVVGNEAIHPIAHSQIECCCAAYCEVTGDVSLVRPFPRKLPPQDDDR